MEKESTPNPIKELVTKGNINQNMLRNIRDSALLTEGIKNHSLFIEEEQKDKELKQKRMKNKLISMGYLKEKVEQLSLSELELVIERLEELKKQEKADKLISELNEI